MPKEGKRMNYLREIRLSELPKSYAGRIPAVRYLFEVGGLKFQKPVTLFVGENGTGKSTLLEAIAVSLGFNAEGGSRDFSFSTKDTHSDLGELLTAVKSISPKDGFFLRAESFYNTASYLDRNSTLLRYGGVSFHAQSHGESFLSLVANRFEGNGIYILDLRKTSDLLDNLRTCLAFDLMSEDSHNPVHLPTGWIYKTSLCNPCLHN